LSTQAFYVSVAKKADGEDPILANILRTVAKDETLHYTFYREAVKAHLQIDPNYVWPLCDVFMNFAMPGYLMPNFHERQRVIAIGANYGIAEYYRQVVDVLVRLLDIKNLHPTYPQAQAALDKLNRYLDSLARLAARAERTRNGDGVPEARANHEEAKRLLGYELWGYEWENPETGATWSNRS
ncbi:MAG TPA: acyl-ACP desaturase, partial [Chloroflexia bacterium]|nr:acyl-ACP desaturase [Chloroflexia bacterium]